LQIEGWAHAEPEACPAGPVRCRARVAGGAVPQADGVAVPGRASADRAGLRRGVRGRAADGTTSLFAAYDLASGSVIAQHYRRHRHQEFLRFLKLIDAAVPKDLDLHLVLDNYATHKTPAVKEWLLKHPRFYLHFTPTSSSWLNLAERWFSELTSRKLRRSAHRSVTELEADIRKWINEWNKNPRPFVWTKSADEILETLAEYCQRIIDPGL
jgi:transposase